MIFRVSRKCTYYIKLNKYRKKKLLTTPIDLNRNNNVFTRVIKPTTEAWYRLQLFNNNLKHYCTIIFASYKKEKKNIDCFFESSR